MSAPQHKSLKKLKKGLCLFTFYERVSWLEVSVARPNSIDVERRRIVMDAYSRCS